MIRKSILALLLAATGVSANANTVTQWNFNSVTPDATIGTGTTTPAIGTGSATLIGGTTSTFASGDVNGGSSDPAIGDDSGWNITAFAAQGSGNKSRGVQFNVSTLGFDHVVLSYDLRHSNSSARSEVVQYSLNGGTTFNDIAQFSATNGDTWFNSRTVDFSSVSGVANNANFTFRVVAAFDGLSSAYAASKDGNTYATTGTWRFDMVTVSAAPVPEPKNYAMLLAGLGVMGFIARRRISR